MSDQKYILLVEDAPFAIESVMSLLVKELGCNVDLAETGQKALTLFKENDYDLVFMDIGLPDSDGVALTREFRKIKEKNRVPVIALTANSDEALKEACFQAVMTGFIKKPLTREKAVYMIQHMCKGPKSWGDVTKDGEK